MRSKMLHDENRAPGTCKVDTLLAFKLERYEPLPALPYSNYLEYLFCSIKITTGGVQTVRKIELGDKANLSAFILA